MQTGTEMLWQRRDCASAEVDGSLVLLDLERLVYHSLNSTATAIWQALQVPATPSTIVDCLQAQFDVEAERCRCSVERLLAELEAQNLVHAASASSMTD